MKSRVLQLDQASAALQAHAAGALERVAAAAPEALSILTAANASATASAFAVSDYLCHVFVQQPEAMAAMARQGRFAQAGAPVLADAGGDDDAFAQLRRQRHREMALLAWADLQGQRDTRATLRAISELADALIQRACALALAADAEHHAAELTPPLIIAMGKLGGRELNFSSDVDILFLHPDGGDEQRYLKLAREIVRWLDTVSAWGRVHRVDVRLRPFGRTGALSLSLTAFERYLQAHARDWERYAYVKARALTGAPDDVARFDELVREFVYRRYLDFGVFDALRATKLQIEREVTRTDRQHDLKRGAGGIREVEFIVQSFQLLRGGRRRALQTTSLHEALAQLDGTADAVDAGAIADAYDLLRHVENRLQMLADQQVHSLPESPLDLERVAAASGAQVAPFLAELEARRQCVRRAFTSVLGSGDPGPEDTALQRLWRAAGSADTLGAARAEHAPDLSDEFADALLSLANSRVLARLDGESRSRLDRLVPELIHAARAAVRPARTLRRLTRVLEGVGRRSAYFSLLNERPQARQRLVDLCAASRRVTNDVAEHPLLLDSLIGLDVDDLPSPAHRKAQLAEATMGIEPSDLDLLTDVLAQFKGGAQFEVAVVDLAQQLPVMQVSDHLTTIAECVLDTVLKAAWHDVRRRYGELPGGAFATVAYGKLGGIELGYGSDLDLVFLYDSAGVGASSDGPRALDVGTYFARLVQRLVGIATATTRAGALYEVDMRLRPSGNSGPLVSRLSAYARYQRERAWTWEHQALLRARAVNGDAALHARFDRLRREVLCQPRDRAALRADVVAMRERMARARPPKPGVFHVKHDPGGLTDVEFLVQYALLAHAHETPELVHYSDHMRHLDALIGARVLGERAGEDLQSAYLTYRTHLHRRALDDGDVPVSETQFADEAARVRALWRELLG